MATPLDYTKTLRDLRDESGMTCRDLEALGIYGESLRRAEAGAGISINTLAALAAAYDVPLAEAARAWENSRKTGDRE